MNLSPEQQAVVDAWGRGVAVMAGAGSGKTTTLVLKCIELLRRQRDARFAAVSFTERSAGDLRAKLSEMISKAETSEDLPRREGGPLAGHWVMTIHGLCGAIIQEFPREAGYDGGEGMLSGPESDALWERAVESLWLEPLSDEVSQALDGMLARESRDGLGRLLLRARELASFGALALARAFRRALFPKSRRPLGPCAGALSARETPRGRARFQRPGAGRRACARAAGGAPRVSRAFRSRFSRRVSGHESGPGPDHPRVLSRGSFESLRGGRPEAVDLPLS